MERSSLDWIIVRPAAFTDSPATTAYRHGFAANEDNLTLKISRDPIRNEQKKGGPMSRLFHSVAGEFFNAVSARSQTENRPPLFLETH